MQPREALYRQCIGVHRLPNIRSLIAQWSVSIVVKVMQGQLYKAPEKAVRGRCTSPGQIHRHQSVVEIDLSTLWINQTVDYYKDVRYRGGSRNGVSLGSPPPPSFWGPPPPPNRLIIDYLLRAAYFDLYN